MSIKLSHNDKDLAEEMVFTNDSSNEMIILKKICQVVSWETLKYLFLFYLFCFFDTFFGNVDICNEGVFVLKILWLTQSSLMSFEMEQWRLFLQILSCGFSEVLIYFNKTKETKIISITKAKKNISKQRQL